MREKELFTRCEKENPILTPDMWHYPAEQVFNSAAAEDENGKTVLLVRVVDNTNRSHLTLAKSDDGKTNWQIDSKPTLEANINFNEFRLGLEDARITWLEEENIFICACTSFRANYRGNPPGISLFNTSSFSSFERVAQPLEPNNKNAALFPRKINGHFALINRPEDSKQGSYVCVSFSPDLKFWGKDKPLFFPRPWGWDNYRVGLGPPPIETKKGWLIIYHGSGGKAARLIYRLGLVLLDLDSLDVKRRSEGWIFGPAKDYEGGRDGIVFSCGAVVKGNELRMYYGGNDDVVALATANLDEVLEYLMKCPEK